MTSIWANAALVVAIVAIPLTISPVITSLLESLWSFTIAIVWPSLAQCEQLGWAEIPNGVIHECTVPWQRCVISLIGQRNVDDLFTMFAEVFTHIERRTFVRKPKQLELSTHYIRTDSKTLKTYLSSLHPEVPLPVKFKRVDGIITAYFVKSPYPPFPTGGGQYQGRHQIEKHEMGCFLEGYPPWYQTVLCLANGNTIPYPVQTHSDIFRGGWIIAVGLGKNIPVKNHFMKRKEPGDHAIMAHRYEAVDRSFERLLHGLEKIAKAFPGEKKVNVTSEMIKELMVIGSKTVLDSIWGLAIDRVFGDSDLPWYKAQPRPVAAGLTNKQCELAIDIFSSYGELLPRDVEKIRPILRAILLLTLESTLEVVSYFIGTGRRQIQFENLVGVPELTQDNYIYLRKKRDDYED